MKAYGGSGRESERVGLAGTLQGEVLVFQRMDIRQISVDGGALIETAFPLTIDSITRASVRSDDASGGAKDQRVSRGRRRAGYRMVWQDSVPLGADDGDCGQTGGIRVDACWTKRVHLGIAHVRQNRD